MVARSQRSGDRAEWSFPLPFADCLLAAALLAVFEPSAAGGGFAAAGGSAAAHVLWAAVGAVMTLSVAWRRRRPSQVWVISTACGGFLLATIGQLDPHVGSPGLLPGFLGSPFVVLPAPLVALYTVASTARARRRLALACSLIMVIPPMLWSLARLSLPGLPAHAIGRARGLLVPPVLGPSTPYLDALVAAGALITAWALAGTAQARRDSAQVRQAAAEAEKAEHDRAVAAEERARIARELHDITAHHISVVTLQAGTARLLAESGQPPSPELLRGIETASRQAMTEIRQALGVIRSTPDGAAPLPGLARLPDLTTQMNLAGLTVTARGDPGRLPASLDLTAYRIVQEGLTNIARHSTARTAELGFDRTATALEVTITDHGPARATPGPPRSEGGAPGGHGLIGLRERIARYGGHLEAGPRPGGGFVLSATLPVRAVAGDWLPGDVEASAPISPPASARRRPVTP